MLEYLEQTLHVMEEAVALCDTYEDLIVVS